MLLPVFNRFERPHHTTVESGNNWVRLNEPSSTHLGSGQLQPRWVRCRQQGLQGRKAEIRHVYWAEQQDLLGVVFHQPV